MSVSASLSNRAAKCWPESPIPDPARDLILPWKCLEIPREAHVTPRYASYPEFQNITLFFLPGCPNGVKCETGPCPPPSQSCMNPRLFPAAVEPLLVLGGHRQETALLCYRADNSKSFPSFKSPFRGQGFLTFSSLLPPRSHIGDAESSNFQSSSTSSKSISNFRLSPHFAHLLHQGEH